MHRQQESMGAARSRYFTKPGRICQNLQPQWQKIRMERLGLTGGVLIQQPSDHFLILGIVLLHLFLKEILAGLAE
jgi:hypothetical protein